MNNKIQEVYIPQTCISIGSSVFEGNPLKSVTFDEPEFSGNPFKGVSEVKFYTPSPRYKTGNNSDYIYDLFTNTLLVGNSKGEIPEGAEILGKHCFAGFNLKDIIIPPSVTTVLEGAFEGCGVYINQLPETVTMDKYGAISERPTLPNCTRAWEDMGLLKRESSKTVSVINKSNIFG